MSIYAIGDLHLSGGVDKPMDVFGSHWVNHWSRIQEDWRCRVREDDIVLIPGDISWAMHLSEAEVDLDSIGILPGVKIMIRGNHDYWWSSVTKIKSILPLSIHILQNDSLSIAGYTFCGTRGWINPGMRDFGEHDLKIYKREIQRLSLSLKYAGTSTNLIVLLHYPPFDDRGRETEIVSTLIPYGPSHVVFGHLHGESAKNVHEGIYGDTQYHLVSCDYLNFKLKQIE